MQKSSQLKSLCGYSEKNKASKWVVAYTAGNAFAAGAMAQLPFFDELALTGIEGLMTMHIMNGIYKFDLSLSMVKSIAAALTAHKAGTTAFKVSSKFLTSIPIIGNSVNAVVAGTTTATLGAIIIKVAEKLDRARKEGKPLDMYIIKDALRATNLLSSVNTTTDNPFDSGNP